MYRQKIRLIFAIILIASCIFCLSPMSFAAKDDKDAFDFSRYDDETGGTTRADRVAQKAMGTAINVIRTVATGVSIIMLSYIGIKYMMAAPSEKADFKKSASIYVLGAILVFAAGNILTIIANFTTSNITT